jgi:cation diffusion facilitator CzcD-associated flavoprotein CzcO
MTEKTAVAVLGAGPYGLSIAAHLREAGVDHRVFGTPMQTWRSGMPEGMFLKSYGFASNLYDPADSFTLESYCADHSVPYESEHLPVAIETFIGYGLAFQERYAPELDQRQVLDLTRSSSGFRLGLDDGGELMANRIVVATGISRFGRIPPVLQGLPEELVTHSSRHSSLGHFDGRSVAIVGAGSSALDLAALLHKRGADVELFCRGDTVIFGEPPEHPRPLASRLKHPRSAIGNGWRSLAAADAAPLFRRLPAAYRLNVVHTLLGPFGGWFIRDDVVGKVPMHTSTSVNEATAVAGDRVALSVVGADGREQHPVFDHVIAATGYKVDLSRLPFLVPEIRDGIACLEGYPVVSANFESSVPGIYFAGLTTASTFGPLVRFACGARLTARRIVRHVRRAPLDRAA